MLYRGVVLPACQAVQACQAGCIHRSRDDIPAHHHVLPRYIWCVGFGTFPPMVPATVAVPLRCRRHRHHHGCKFFFFFLNSNKSNLFFFKIKLFSNKSNLFVFKIKLFSSKSNLFVFKIKFFSTLHVFVPRLASDCWILGRDRLWMNQCTVLS